MSTRMMTNGGSPRAMRETHILDIFQQLKEERNVNGRRFEDLCNLLNQAKEDIGQINSKIKQLQVRNGAVQEMEYYKQLLTSKQQEFQAGNNRLNELSQGIIETMWRHYSVYDNSLTRAMQLLSNWKRLQKVAQYGGRYPIEELSQICNDFRMLWRDFLLGLIHIQKLAPTFSSLAVAQNFNHLKNTFMFLCNSILGASYIVVEQPPMLVKSNLTVKVGFLAMEQHFGFGPETLKTQCRVISEETASKIKNNMIEITDKIDTLGTINNVKIKDTELSQFMNDYMGFELRNIKIRVNSRKATAKDKDVEAVKTKYYLMFNVNIAITGTNTIMKLCTLTLPFMVSVHGSQDANLMATAFWDTAFSPSSDDVRMTGPAVVPWNLLGEALKHFFLFFTTLKAKEDSNSTVPDRGLSDSDLLYLKTRLFNGKTPDNPNPQITWENFFQESLKHVPIIPNGDLDLSFWSWFFSICNMILEKPGHETKMKALWDARFIEGFVSKEGAEQRLLKCKPTPTFLIRFSENHSASVSFVIYEGRGVKQLKPFKLKEWVEKLSLPGLIRSCEDLDTVDYVYPNKSKFEVENYLPKAKKINSPGIYDSIYMIGTLKISDANQPHANVPNKSPRKNSSMPKSPQSPDVDRQCSNQSATSSSLFESDDNSGPPFSPGLFMENQPPSTFLNQNEYQQDIFDDPSTQDINFYSSNSNNLSLATGIGQANMDFPMDASIDEYIRTGIQRIDNGLPIDLTNFYSDTDTEMEMEDYSKQYNDL